MSEKDDDVIILIEDTNNQSPKITGDLVNVPITPMSQENKLLTLYEFGDKKNSECQTENGESKDNLNDRKDKLYKSIKENKKKITKKSKS